MTVAFETHNPIPPTKKLIFRLDKLRKWWFSKKRIEVVTVEGPATGLVQVYWIVPDYLHTSNDYFFTVLQDGDIVFRTATFTVDNPVMDLIINPPTIDSGDVSIDNSTNPSIVLTNSTIAFPIGN